MKAKMKKYQLNAAVTLHSGKLKLTEEQAGQRAYGINLVKDGVYEITAPMQFKAGEKFGYDGVIPKAILEAEAPDDEIETVVQDFIVDMTYLKENHPDLIREIEKEAEISVIDIPFLEAEYPELLEEIKQPGEASNIDNIIEAIELLEDGNKDHWTNEGLPQVSGIEAVMDINISAAERDEAVAKISKIGALLSRFVNNKE